MTTEHLQEQLARNPRSPLFARLAYEYLRSQRTDEALKLCIDGLPWFPNYITAHVIAASCLAQKGEYSTALSHLNTALRVYPDNPSLTTLCNEWTNQIASARPKLPHEHDEQSRSIENTKQNASIGERTQEEDSLDDEPIVSVTLAEIYATQGAYEAAIAMYRKLQQQKPQQVAQFEAKIQELTEKIRQRE